MPNSTPRPLDGRLLAMIRLAGDQPPAKVLAVVFGLLVVIAALDYITGWELSFAVFYAAPVAVSAWYLGRARAWTIAIVCAVVWLGVNLLAGQTYQNQFIPFWNTVVRLGFFLIIAEALMALRWTLLQLRALVTDLEHTAAREMELSRTDALTGARNARAFYEAVDAELQRCRRYNRPMSVAYLDADGFKAVNDTLGHAEGDRVLKATVATMREKLRVTDTVARLGGDEFGVLFPETDEVALFVALEKIQFALSEAMRLQGWEVTFSIGGVHCQEECDTSVADLVHAADRIMYEVKRHGRNSLRIRTLASDGLKTLGGAEQG